MNSSSDECAFITDWAIAPSSWSRRDRHPSSGKDGAGHQFPPLSHDQLLELAHQTAEAARDHDPDRVEADALRLFEALSDHVLAERAAFFHLPAGDARLIRRGRQQIEDLLLDLAASAAEKTGSCECERLADDVVAQLALQATEERRQLLAAAD